MDRGTRAEPRFFHARRRALYARAVTHGALGVTPVLGTIILLHAYAHAGSLALDFDHSMWVGGHRAVHGLTPYVAGDSPELATGEPFVYPAPALLLALPFTLLSQGVAGAVWTGLCLLSVLLALGALGVRDWRVYGVVLLWPAVVSGWQSGNVTLPLMLGVACAWRWRDRPVVAGALVGALASVKLFTWPLGLWLLATRRYRAAAWALGTGAALNLAAWATIGFDEVGRYRGVVDGLTRAREQYSYSVVALAEHHDLGRGGAYALAAVVAATVAVVCIRAGRRGGDATCFALAVAVTLLATPLIWLHYYALLAVPLALHRPRFGLAWVLPLALWASIAHTDGWPGTWVVLLALALVALLSVPSLPGWPAAGRGARAPA